MKAYHEIELHALMDLPLYLIMATAAVDQTGPVSFLLEVKAGIESIRAAQQAFTQNELLAHFFAFSQRLTSDDLPQNAAPSTGDLLAHIDEVLPLLDGDPDSPGYRAFLYYLAEQVAGESGEGFWGRGQKVSAEEASFLRALHQRLGLG